MAREIADIENWTADILETLALLERAALNARTAAERRQIAGLIETRRRRLAELRVRRAALQTGT